MARVGVNIRGRSSRLTLSYRTTREILARAVGIVDPGAYDDLDDGTDAIDGYRSVLRGPAPELVGYDGWAAELDALALVVRKWRDEIADGSRNRKDPRGAIAVCVTSRERVAEVVTRLADEGVGTAELTKDGPQGGGEVHVGTMHRFKGLEYQRIAIAGVSEGVVPRAALERIRDTDPPRYRREEVRGRSLLFVAATRARDTLRISWHGRPSRFLGST